MQNLIGIVADYAKHSVTDLRIGQIGHGLGSALLGAPCNSFL